MVPAERVPISLRALIQRINRRLKHEGRYGQGLRKSRSQRWYSDLGDYYIVDFDTNFIVAGHVNLEEYGREIGALELWEYLLEKNE